MFGVYMRQNPAWEKNSSSTGGCKNEENSPVRQEFPTQERMMQVCPFKHVRKHCPKQGYFPGISSSTVKLNKSQIGLTWIIIIREGQLPQDLQSGAGKERRGRLEGEIRLYSLLPSSRP